MEKYVFGQKFSIKYCDVDFKDELKTSVALSLMEEVACLSADELGFGYSFVKEKGYAFMIVNIACEFYRPIELGETIVAQTWPTPPVRVSFGREYRFQDENGEVLMNASSRWCLVDIKRGRLLTDKALDPQDYTQYNTEKTLDVKTWKLPIFSIDEGELKFSLKIANSEYDHNMHVNNTRYADYCFNCFSLSELQDKKLAKFSISYVKQCKESETLRFYRKETKENGYLIQGYNEKEEIVVQASIEFSL